VSDDLLLSGGGSTAVATEELLEHAQDLERVRDGLEACRARLASWPLTEDADARVTNHLTWARGAVEDALLESTSLVRALRRSAERYGALERSLALVQRTAGEAAAYWAGVVLPGLVLIHGPAVALALAVGAVTVTSPQGRAAARGVGVWLRDNPAVVNNALVASLARTAVSSVDDFGLGVLRVPPPTRRLLEEQGLDLGLPTAGLVVTGAAGAAGMLRETRVVVHRVPEPAGSVPAVAAAPRGFADLAGRLPRAAPDGAQVRVERYGEGTADRRFIVYVGGTADASPRSTSDPWDVTSDVGAVTGGDAGAVRATEQAMRAAGVGPDDRVLLAGYSLGGIVARDIADRGSFAVDGVLSLGSPVGQIPVPDGVSAVSVEHNEDVLAALGGHGLADEDGGHALVVRRSVADELTDGGGTLFAAHGLDRYAETAALLDESEEERIAGFRSTLSTFLGDREQGSVTEWRAERVVEAPGPPPSGGSGGGFGVGVGGAAVVSPADAGRSGPEGEGPGR